MALEKNGSNLLDVRRQLLLLGIIAAVASIALAIAILSISSPRFSASLTNLPLLLLNGQHIDIEGEFACVPTTGYGICIMGFRDNDGRYFLLTNFEEILMANPSLDTSADETFAVSGTFSYGSPDKPEYAVVAGQIDVMSLESVGDNTQFVIP